MEKSSKRFLLIISVLAALCIVLGYLYAQQKKMATDIAIDFTEYIDKYESLEKDLEKVVQRSIFVQDSLSKIIENKDDEIVKYMDNVKKEQEKYRTIIHRIRKYDADSSASLVSGRIR